MGRRPAVIAHRGASGVLPENTLPAYERAIEQGADMIEIDLHRTRDGAIVVMHDAELAGLGGRGEIADALLEDVRALDAGGGERVPTLDEVLGAFASRIPFNLELKRPERGAYPELEARALEAARRHGILETTLFSCFDDAVLARLRELSPEARLALLYSPRRRENVLERARALRAEAVNPWFRLVDAALMEIAHGAGLAVYPFTADEENDLRRLLDLGVDGIFTNFPDRLRALVDAGAGPGGPPPQGEESEYFQAPGRSRQTSG
jgi:glycerophosphoryl diester phosphodiesterase